MAIMPESRIRQLGFFYRRRRRRAATTCRPTVGKLVHLAGAISSHASGVVTATVGFDRTIEQGYPAARCCALEQLSVLQKHLGSLDAVKNFVGVTGYVNSVAGFADSPKVLDGSDLFVEIFGEARPPGSRRDRGVGPAA